MHSNRPACRLLSLPGLMVLLSACATHDDALQAPSRSAVLTRPSIEQPMPPTRKTLEDPNAPGTARVVVVSPAPGDRAAGALGAVRSGAPSTDTSHAAVTALPPAQSRAVTGPAPRGVDPSLVSIEFARGQDVPLALAPAALQALADRGKRTSMILVAGFARPGGDSNLELAKRRAATVKGALVERGVDEARIRTVATIAESDTLDATRVDVRFVGEERVRR